jgi:hypothetical protein
LHTASPETTVYLPVPVVFPNAANRMINNWGILTLFQTVHLKWNSELQITTVSK